MIKNSKKTIKVSVGISALNEEKTIGSILDSILSQTQNGWTLTDILVYSDGSIDKTLLEVRKKSSSLIKVRDFRERKGKPFRCSQMLKVFKGDILVIFDADIKISDSDVITNLIEEFRNGKDIMLVGGDSRVFPPRNFFEKAIYTSYYVYYKSREKLRDGDNAFACTGACIALRREFAKQVTIPKWVICEDSYFYFSCLKAGYKFKYAPYARVYYKMAANLKDYIKQMFRSSPEAVNLIYKKHFGDLIREEYYRPTTFYLKAILETFCKNPLGTMYMVSLKLFAQPFYFYFSKRYKLSWYTAASTKGSI